MKCSYYFPRCHYKILHIFQNQNFSTTNLFSDVIIVRISQKYRLSWYGFFSLCPATLKFWYCVKICYCINFKLWMKYCACWHCDDTLLGMLIPIPISVYLNITKILCFNNQYPRSYIFPSIFVLACCVYAFDVNMIT